MSFPTSINYGPAPAVEGDFCDANPRSTVNAGTFGLVVGSAGAVVGRFHWASTPVDGDGAPAAITNSGTGPVTGFLHREQQGLITTFLAENGMMVPPGFPITLFKSGGFWVINRGSAAVTKNMVVYASLTDGSIAGAASGATVSGYVATKWIVMTPAAVGGLFKMSSQPEG